MPDETIRIVTSDIPGESPQIEPDVPLKSERGVDYTKLRDLLATGEWKEADRETAIKMLEVAERTKDGWLRDEDLDRFPCEDLRTIDQLWVKYSNGRFGFSVQKRIYESLGGSREYDRKIWEAFGDRVGWRVNSQWLFYENLKFNTNKADQGHLPTFSNGGGWLGDNVRGDRKLWGGIWSLGGNTRWNLSSLASKLVEFNI
ncbi:GUN4 domain-containing protein [Microcoleus vaginatus]|uniref:GUN4 domain-containing protein n=1 Tax=Microcoleus vaginatus TaxID=119532 RepID=UPI00168988D3|nr:GUN4 domain-containing protein [Microcoleus sp. FACHB-84]MBD2011630.1 GUN4 domain-containing protein [Microcoleus sp. FACHB-45]